MATDYREPQTLSSIFLQDADKFMTDIQKIQQYHISNPDPNTDLPDFPTLFNAAKKLHSWVAAHEKAADTLLRGRLNAATGTPGSIGLESGGLINKNVEEEQEEKLQPTHNLNEHGATSDSRTDENAYTTSDDTIKAKFNPPPKSEKVQQQQKSDKFGKDEDKDK